MLLRARTTASGNIYGVMMTVKLSALEHKPCALCGADEPQPQLQLDDLLYRTLPHPVQLVRCQRCGFLYLTPQPTPKREAEFYPQAYGPHHRHGLTAWARQQLLRHEVRALWPYLAPPRRILEIGCGTGDLLQLIREAGNPNVAGLEPREQAVARAQARNLAVQRGRLEDFTAAQRCYDTILLQHVLEHLDAPVKALRRIAGFLKPGGVLILWLPNGASWAARVFGSAWIGYDPPRHRSVFTPTTLGRALAQAGLTTREVHHEWHGLDWAWGLRLLVRQHSPEGVNLDRLLRAVHLPLIVAATPVAVLAALTHRSGRIRVVAQNMPC